MFSIHERVFNFLENRDAMSKERTNKMGANVSELGGSMYARRKDMFQVGVSP